MPQTLTSWRIPLIAVVTVLVVSGVSVVALSSESGNATFRLIGPAGESVVSASSSDQSVTPPLVPSAYLPQLGSDWTSIGSAVPQAVVVAPSSGNGAGGTLATAADVGLSGSILQGWVRSDAVALAGGVSSLTLPLSSAYANSVVGPTEIFVTEYEFLSSSGASSFFDSINYANNGFGTVVSGLSNSLGNITQVSSNVNGETVFNVQWLSGDFVVNLSVWGGNSLTATDVLGTVFPRFGNGGSLAPPGVTPGQGASGDPVYASYSQLPWGR